MKMLYITNTFLNISDMANKSCCLPDCPLSQNTFPAKTNISSFTNSL